VYFYYSLVFPEIAKEISHEKIKCWLVLAILLIVAGDILDWNALTDITVVGQNFELSKADYTYVNPAIVAVNLLVSLVVAGLLVKGTDKYIAILSFLGMHSLQIYLWHILVLYFLAWRYESVLNTVKSAPELIVGFALFVAILIAVLAAVTNYLLSLPGRYYIEMKVTKMGRS